MAAGDPSSNQTLSQLVAIVDRLHPIAMMAALAMALPSRAALDCVDRASPLVASLDAIFPGGALIALVAFFAVPLSLLEEARQHRRAARRAEEKRIDDERRARDEAQADAAQRKMAYAACTADEKAILSVFVNSSKQTLSLDTLVRSNRGYTRQAQFEPRELVLAVALERAIDALASRRFLFGPAERDSLYTLEQQCFDELVANPALIGLTTPGRPALPKTKK